MKHLAFLLIRGYQWVVSPALHALMGPEYGCRFSPTCSDYCRSCFEKQTFFKATLLSVKRVASCHPWSKRERFDPPSITQEEKEKDIV